MRNHWDSDGAYKIVPSDGWPAELGVGMRLVDTRAEMRKLADTIFGSTYEQLRPPKGHTGIHLVAYGDFEKWGANRNADSFPQRASAARHGTFVTHGKVYRNHANKDPAKAIGDVLKSAHSLALNRVELFVSMDDKKAADSLQRLAKEGELAWSMGCKVPGDRCDICQTFRKNARDPRQCAHVRDHLGDILPDGRMVAVHNDDPMFYDISEVPRGADRTAFDLKVASHGRQGINSGHGDHEFSRCLADGNARAQARIALSAKMAAVQARMRAPELCSPGQRAYDVLLAKAACTSFSPAELEIMRAVPPAELWSKLAAAGVVLPASAFFACAYHGDPEFEACAADAAKLASAGTFLSLRGREDEQAAATNTYFDLDSRVRTGNQWATGSDACTALNSKLAAQSFARDATQLLLAGGPAEILRPPQPSSAGDTAYKAAGVYAAYKLSAVRAIGAYHPRADNELLIELAAAQDLIN